MRKVPFNPAAKPLTVEAPNTAILTLEEYKVRRQLDEANPLRDEAITASLEAAEDDILKYTDRDFGAAAVIETRPFPWEIHSTVLDTDDFTGEPLSITFELPGIGEAAIFPTNTFWVGPREGPTFYYIDFTPARQLSSTSIGAMGFTRNLDTFFARGGADVDAVTVQVEANWGWPGGAPASIKQAAVWLVDEFNAATPGANGEEIQAEGIANLTYAYQREPSKERAAVLPPRVQQLLDAYRRVSV